MTTRKSLLIVLAMLAVFVAGLPVAGSVGAVPREEPTVTVETYCDGVWGEVGAGADLTDWFLGVKTTSSESRTPLALVGDEPSYSFGGTGDGVVDFALYDGGDESGGGTLVNELTSLDGTFIRPEECGGAIDMESTHWAPTVDSSCDTVTISLNLNKPLDPWYFGYVVAPNGFVESPPSTSVTEFPELVFDVDGLRGHPDGGEWGGNLYGSYHIALWGSGKGDYFEISETVHLVATKPSDEECPPSPVGTFNDDDDSVFESDIEWMAAEGITKGCNPPVNDRFCPDSVVTRGQMAAFLTRALGLTERLDDPFIDDDDSVFEADIEKLAAAGITKGCNPPVNDRFCPDGKVTREVMAAFLVRALGYTDNGGGDLFTDDDDSIFEADIDRLGTAGVTRGCNPPTNDRYCPSGNVTRGQMAAFLHRALG